MHREWEIGSLLGRIGPFTLLSRKFSCQWFKEQEPPQRVIQPPAGVSSNPADDYERFQDDCRGDLQTATGASVHGRSRLGPADQGPAPGTQHGHHHEQQERIHAARDNQPLLPSSPGGRGPAAKVLVKT